MRVYLNTGESPRLGGSSRCSQIPFWWSAQVSSNWIQMYTDLGGSELDFLEYEDLVQRRVCVVLIMTMMNVGLDLWR